MSGNCVKSCHRHSIYCILPPYILDSIILNGTEEHREIALRVKSLDTTFRSMRIANQSHLMARRHSSSVEGAFNAHKSITIYSADNNETLPGRLVSPQTGDVAVDEAYRGLDATFDFYDTVFGRNSIDDNGLPLVATVHFGDKFDNAFWNSTQMVFGDGDGTLFNRFTIALDVIGHELTHGVTEHEAGLQYLNQSGALNESLSDVFGSLIKQRVLNHTAETADWLIGVGLLASGVNGIALRSMSNPGTAFDDPRLGKDPQPKHMKNYVHTLSDNGGVHTNSGIPNHAFYQVATKLGGYAWEKAGRIWYEALQSPNMRPNCSFQRFARITVKVAEALYTANSAEVHAVRDGWAVVGIKA